MTATSPSPPRPPQRKHARLHAGPFPPGDKRCTAAGEWIRAYEKHELGLRRLA
jgi:hypothetical protein